MTMDARRQCGKKASSCSALHVHGFFIFHAKQHPHRVLIIHEAQRRKGDAVSQKPLCLRRQSLCFFRWDHQILVLCLSVIWLAKEDSNRLSELISVRKSAFPITVLNILMGITEDLLCDVPATGMV